MPRIEFPSLLTTNAPICSVRSWPEARSAVSCGGTGFTAEPLIRKMSATFMLGSIWARVPMLGPCGTYHACRIAACGVVLHAAPEMKEALPPYLIIDSYV